MKGIIQREIKMRINKYLAHCGIASRRKSEELILDGRITVNGNIIMDLSFIIEKNDKVYVDDNPIKIPKNFEYYILQEKS